MPGLKDRLWITSRFKTRTRHYICELQGPVYACKYRPTHELPKVQQTFGARGGEVVKTLRYKPAGRGFDSRLCHWNFSVT